MQALAAYAPLCRDALKTVVVYCRKGYLINLASMDPLMSFGFQNFFKVGAGCMVGLAGVQWWGWQVCDGRGRGSEEMGHRCLLTCPCLLLSTWGPLAPQTVETFAAVFLDQEPLIKSNKIKGVQGGRSASPPAA